MNSEPISIPLRELFNSGEYVIPVYQRNYAWGETEVKQLIQDIYDFAEVDSDKNYFIGTLVVYERHELGNVIYEIIDGQQRLTTLNILFAVLHREFDGHLSSKVDFRLNLRFAARVLSTITLQQISSFEDASFSFDTGVEYNSHIRDAYEVVKKQLNSLFQSSNVKLNQFYSYLAENVNILRVSVPHDTNRNHYFEIMNTRGEQLEKHEVLKARLMREFGEDKPNSIVFSKIWEACSDMSRYVQYGFDTNERKKIFTDSWSKLEVSCFDDIVREITSFDEAASTKSTEADKQKFKISNIVNDSAYIISEDKVKKEALERFTSVIDFPNFLLHVLRVQTRKDVSLDDKRLMGPFEKELDALLTLEKRVDFVKTFSFNLLKCRILFDSYVIKREVLSEKDGWTLKRLKCDESGKESVTYENTFEDRDGKNLNRRILMLMAMFHVSAPTLIYKHWLNACLLFLYDNGNVEAGEYRSWLENLAQCYLYDRYLARESAFDFYEIIYKNKVVTQNKENQAKYDWSKLNAGTAVENFVFNYLDYILWVEKSIGYKEFEFSFRSSVEHYYPQNPLSNNDRLEQSVLDQIGNLCLISRSKNSALGRNMPPAKKDHYVRVKPDSLKQRLMMEESNWGEQQITEHTLRMTKKLREYNYAI